jgi:hypothetical protein
VYSDHRDGYQIKTRTEQFGDQLRQDKEVENKIGHKLDIRQKLTNLVLFESLVKI